MSEDILVLFAVIEKHTTNLSLDPTTTDAFT